jgi:hypothetical protein
LNNSFGSNQIVCLASEKRVLVYIRPHSSARQFDRAPTLGRKIFGVCGLGEFVNTDPTAKIMQILIGLDFTRFNYFYLDAIQRVGHSPP